MKFKIDLKIEGNEVTFGMKKLRRMIAKELDEKVSQAAYYRRNGNLKVSIPIKFKDGSTETEENNSLSDDQLLCLKAISNYGYAAEISRQVKLSPPKVNHILNQLECYGYIVRHRYIQDRRIIYLKLTSKGHKILENLYCMWFK